MKRRVFSFLLGIMLALSLVACGSDEMPEGERIELNLLPGIMSFVPTRRISPPL